MPSLGSISPTCVPWATEEVQAFACTLKLLIPRVRPGATMAEKARALQVSPSLLSHWINGRRLPRTAALQELIARAVEGLPENEEVALRREFAPLEQLLQRARRSSCSRCEGGCACRGAAGQVDRRNSLASDGADEDDRRNSSRGGAPADTGSASADAEPDTVVRLAALPLADRVAFMWALGATLDEGGLVEVVEVLARARMYAEMEVVLRSAESAGWDLTEIAPSISGCA